jgi:hypothetical protein
MFVMKPNFTPWTSLYNLLKLRLFQLQSSYNIERQRLSCTPRVTHASLLLSLFILWAQQKQVEKYKSPSFCCIKRLASPYSPTVLNLSLACVSVHFLSKVKFLSWYVISPQPLLVTKIILHKQSYSAACGGWTLYEPAGSAGVLFIL